MVVGLRWQQQCSCCLSRALQLLLCAARVQHCSAFRITICHLGTMKKWCIANVHYLRQVR